MGFLVTYPSPVVTCAKVFTSIHHRKGGMKGGHRRRKRGHSKRKVSQWRAPIERVYFFRRGGCPFKPGLARSRCLGLDDAESQKKGSVVAIQTRRTLTATRGTLGREV